MPYSLEPVPGYLDPGGAAFKRGDDLEPHDESPGVAPRARRVGASGVPAAVAVAYPQQYAGRVQRGHDVTGPVAEKRAQVGAGGQRPGVVRGTVHHGAENLGGDDLQ